jgi:LPXTG-site transpeptidase (sortase) family protein
MKINKKQKELIRIYIFLFMVIFVAINWDSLSWMFNYREVTGLVYDFFNPYQDSDLLVSANTLRVTAPPLTATNSVQTKVNYPYSAKENSIEIPSLNLVTPLVIGQSTDIPTLEKDLDKGAVYYPGSVLPGQIGQILVLGHSAPPGWPHIKHDWVFSDIDKLNIGDMVTLYFNHTQYTYRIVKKDIVPRGQEVGADTLNGKNNILTLVSCWPPGKDYKRIAISAELMN